MSKSGYEEFVGKEKKKKEEKRKMVGVTCYIPDNYEGNIQKLIEMKITASRSEAIRTALRDYLQKEYSINLKLLGFFNGRKEDNKVL